MYECLWEPLQHLNSIRFPWGTPADSEAEAEKMKQYSFVQLIMHMAALDSASSLSSCKFTSSLSDFMSGFHLVVTLVAIQLFIVGRILVVAVMLLINHANILVIVISSPHYSSDALPYALNCWIWDSSESRVLAC